jgi:hypothetical protein
MTDKEKAALGCFGLVAVVPAALWAGFVISKLWLWFVVPLGVPPITMWTGVGFDLLLSFITHQTHKETPEPTWNLAIAGLFVKPAAFLLCGWAIVTWGAP